MKDRLELFYQERFPRPTEVTWARLLRQNARIKMLSIGLAVLSWLLFAYGRYVR
jgi:hypothetical protein